MVDPSGAMKAVNSIVAKCMRMQGPWIWRNPQTERLEFLHLQKSSSDIMEQPWNLYLEDTSQTLPVENRAQTTPGEAPQERSPDSTADDGKGGKEGKGGKSGKGGKGGKGGKEGKGGKDGKLWQRR